MASGKKASRSKVNSSQEQLTLGPYRSAVSEMGGGKTSRGCRNPGEPKNWMATHDFLLPPLIPAQRGDDAASVAERFPPHCLAGGADAPSVRRRLGCSVRHFHGDARGSSEGISLQRRTDQSGFVGSRPEALLVRLLRCNVSLTGKVGPAKHTKSAHRKRCLIQSN